MGFWTKMRVFSIFLQLIRNPNRTELIFKGVDIVSKDPNYEPVKDMEKMLLDNQEFRTLYESNYNPRIPKLEELKDCPQDSFGLAVYKHMDANHLDFDLFPRFRSDQPIQYLSSRIYQDHDLWHALFGYGIEVEDELAIQAFGIAQFHAPFAILIVSAGLIHLLFNSPRRAINAFKKINDLFNLGKKVPFLLSVRLHEMFNKPLSEVRAICQTS